MGWMVVTAGYGNAPLAGVTVTHAHSLISPSSTEAWVGEPQDRTQLEGFPLPEVVPGPITVWQALADRWQHL